MGRRISGFVIAVLVMGCPVAAWGWQPPEDLARKSEAARARRAAMLRQAAGLGTWVPAEAPLRFDVHTYDLDLRFDFERERVAGVVTLSVEVVEDGLETLELDADSGLRVSAVWLENDGSYPRNPPSPLAFTHVEDRLFVGLQRLFGKGETLEVAVAYAGTASRLGDGVTWKVLGESTPSATTMAEPFGARVWVPCQDRPDDKAQWTLRITAPAELTVGANGVRVVRTENGDGTATTVWSSRYPVATYLVVVDISDYRIIEDVYTGLNGADSMPVETWAYAWNEEKARTAFSNTPALLHLLASHFGEYPFLAEKYGNCLAPIWAGGMEHQTFTSVAGGTGPDDNGVLESRSVRYLDIHEAAHQWWGDWVSPATWKDLWLNESFASYAELLLAESDGQLRRFMDSEDWRGWFPGPLYDNPVPFSVTVYDKGARVLRMLEHLLGRRTFENALGEWRRRFGGGSGTTGQLRQVLEEVSGRNLSWFFDQWVYGSGRPHLRWSWERVDGPAVRLRLEQVQTNAGLFRFPLDVDVRMDSGSESHSVEVQAVGSQTIEIPVSAEPTSVILDPGNWLLEEKHTVSEPDLDLGSDFQGEIVFPPMEEGRTATVTIPVANVGGSALTVSGWEVHSSDAFVVELPMDGLKVDPGSVRDLSLHFTPHSVGADHGWIALYSNDPANGGTTWIEVSGVGAVAPGIAIQVSSRVRWADPVPVGSAAERLVTIGNVGTELARVDARVSGVAFSLPGTTTLSIPPGAEALLVVRFAPAVEGFSHGRLELEPEGGSPAAVVLEGSGTAAARLVVEPGVLLFGILAPGQAARETLRLENLGGETLTIGDITVEGRFSVEDGPSLPLRLDPGAFVDLTVKVHAAGVGVEAGRLRIGSDDSRTPIVIVPLRAVIREGRIGGRTLIPAGRVRPVHHDSTTPVHAGAGLRIPVQALREHP